MLMNMSEDVMSRPNIHEVRENLADYVAAAERGDEVLICRRNQPVARLVGLRRPPPSGPRLLGGAPDAGMPLPKNFFKPLPPALHAALAGQAAAHEDPLAAA
jgi:prevent-host-death family protein